MEGDKIIRVITAVGVQVINKKVILIKGSKLSSCVSLRLIGRRIQHRLKHSKEMVCFKDIKLLGNHRKACLFYIIKMHTLKGLGNSQVKADRQHQVKIKGNKEKGQGSGHTLWEPGGGS